MARQTLAFSVILLLDLVAPSLSIHALPVTTPQRKQQQQPRINRTTKRSAKRSANRSAIPPNSSRIGSRLNAMRRAWETPNLECNADTPNMTYALSGEQAPGPGVICSVASGECTILIGDECCAPDNQELYYWCEIPPMCTLGTPGAVYFPFGYTPTTKGIYCKTVGEFLTCFEALAYKQQVIAGFFCPHSYFWAKNEYTECTDLLLNPAYNGLRFAKAACINAGDECFGVLDTNCDGYEDTRLCSKTTTRSALVHHPQSCVHEKLYRTPSSYHALCTEQGDGAERVDEGHTFEEEGVFCEDGLTSKCYYVQQNDVASKAGSFCFDTRYAVGPTDTFTTTTQLRK